VRLGRRHSELLVLLLEHPEGRTGDQLSFDLYADDLNPVTVRAELSRLRRTLGADVLDSRPYRLLADVDADFLAVRRLLEAGRTAEALDAYTGPLLPSSDAPGVVRLRRMVENEMRTAVLAAGDPHLARTWVGTAWGADDLQVWESYATLLPASSPTRGLVARRARELAAEFGVATSLQRPRN
jgi:hypothetical protein